MLSPLICGTLGETVSYEAGFGAAGVGMCLGLTVYVLGLGFLAPDPSVDLSEEASSVGPSTSPHPKRELKAILKQDWRALVGILVTW